MTATPGNGETALPTAKKRRGRPRTGWELRELIRPLPARPRRRSQGVAPEQPFYPALVETVFDSRFLTGGQVERRFPQWLTSPATTHRHLANLVDRKYLATASVRSTGPNFPLVYFATQKGIRLIKEAYAAHGIRWEASAAEERKARGQALDSILHELLVSEVDLALLRTTDNREDLQLLERERRYYRRERQLTYFDRGATRTVVPDSGFLVAVAGRGGERTLLPLHLVELDNGTHSVAAIRRKYQAYARWAASEGDEYLRRLYEKQGARPKRPTFRLLMIAHDKYNPGGDERRLLDLFLQALELPRSMRTRIWLTTARSLQVHQFDKAPLSAPLWYRLTDACSWLSEYRQFVAGLPQKRGSKKYVKQRRFVAERLPGMPRHPLFPFPRRSPEPQSSTRSVIHRPAGHLLRHRQLQRN